MKNREPICLCTGDFAGTHCETNWKAALDRTKNIYEGFLKAANNPDNGKNSPVHTDANGNQYINAHSNTAIQQVKELNQNMKNTKVVRNMGRRKVKKLFHLIGNSIMKRDYSIFGRIRGLSSTIRSEALFRRHCCGFTIFTIFN